MNVSTVESDPVRLDRRTFVRSWWPVVAAWVLAGVMAAATSSLSLSRYRDFRSAYAWDLAYYNQWFWALTKGDGQITVRPVAWYAVEGPSVWKMNYLAPMRFAIAPIYAFAPGPETLILIQNIVFWCVAPAAFSLARSESRSSGLAITAAALMPLTPLAWPLVFNDFRELQLAPPFILWAIQGWRERRKGLAAVGIGGLLACRQEFAVLVATLALLPPREKEPFGRTVRWGVTAVAIGSVWILAFFGYLMATVGPDAPLVFVSKFSQGGGGMTALARLRAAVSLLSVGLGSWAVLSILAPRVALLAVPWIVFVLDGKWDLDHLSLADDWHHVRYTAPAFALVLASGLIGYVRLGNWLLARRGGPWLVAALTSAAVAGLLIPAMELNARIERVPRTFDKAESAYIWSWVKQVSAREGVITSYDVAAALSSRSSIYSNYSAVNYPPSFPVIGPEVRWVFLRRDLFTPLLYERQGFTVVGRGPRLWVLRRATGNGER
jgi:Predicted membrane protein (DUF2079)